MTRHSASVALSAFGLALGACATPASPPPAAPPRPAQADLFVPESLRPYTGKAPVVRVDFDGLEEFTLPARMLPWFHVSVFDDGLVAYFVHPCGDDNGIRTKHLDKKQMRALADVVRRECDALVTDPPGLQCEDAARTSVACAGAGGFRKVKLTCASGDQRRAGARFIAEALELVALGGIQAPIARACRAATVDAVTVHGGNPYDMTDYFQEPPSAGEATAGEATRKRKP